MALTAGFVYVQSTQRFTEARCAAGAYLTKADGVSDMAAEADLHDATLGSMTMDPVSSTAYGPNLIKNGSAEAVADGKPDNWDSFGSGANSAQYSIVPGRSGANAVRTTITGYKDGDGHWFALPLDVTPGAYFEYEDYYKSDIQTRAVLQLIDASGNFSFVNLANAPATANWSVYRVKFFVPNGTAKVVVYHNLTGNGTLDIDDTSLKTARVGQFSQPMVSVTFDDGWKSIHNKALPVLNKHQVPSTQYLVSGYLGMPGYMTAKDILEMRRSGHEVGSHTISHVDLTTLGGSRLDSELKTSKKDLSHCFGEIRSIAVPYGAYNDASVKAVQKHYDIGRSTDTGFNTADTLQPYALKVQNVDQDTSPEQIRQWLESAKANKTWLILVYHQIDESSSYSRSSAQLDADLQAVKQSGIKAVTISDGYNLASQSVSK